ncbi:hypothetical protein JCM10914A_45860 [Paenibacillus sp. JCM 10914]
MVTEFGSAERMDFDRDGLTLIFGPIAKVKCMARFLCANALIREDDLSYEKKYYRHCYLARFGWVGNLRYK